MLLSGIFAGRRWFYEWNGLTSCLGGRRRVSLRIAGFIWLEQIVEKLARKHDVTPEEVEFMFAQRPRYRFVEKGHIAGENLYSAMGQTEDGRVLIAFFVHEEDKRALIISARNMDAAEKKRYGRK